MTRSRPRTRGTRSPKVSEAFRAFVLDQLAEVGDVVPKAMFGCVGLYSKGVFFGIIAGDTLYLKVRDASGGADRAARARPFTPYPGRRSTKYFAVPVDVLESAPELTARARKAIAAAAG